VDFSGFSGVGKGVMVMRGNAGNSMVERIYIEMHMTGCNIV